MSALRLNYAFGNEDWKTEREALRVQPNDRVLCITASGDRPLNLLIQECQKIVCIDANCAQSHLLELKLAAMQMLSYEEYLAFLGVFECSKRKALLEILLSQMSEEAAAFWKKNKKLIFKGVLYQGSLERLMKNIACLTLLFRRHKVNKLFLAATIEEQKRIVEKDWHSALWRKIFQIVFTPAIARLLINDPSLQNIDPNSNPGMYIYDKMQDLLKKELVRNSPLLSLVWRGQVSLDAFSPYLQKEGVALIKKRLSCLEIHSTDVIDYLKSVSKHTFDVFSLSDVASTLNYHKFVELLEQMIRVAKPGARFCMRQFLTAHHIPRHLHTSFVRHYRLEKRLEQQDNCFVYRFLVGNVIPTSINLTLNSGY